MRWVLENKFRITCEKFWRNVGNLEKIFEKFWTDYVEILWTFLWNLVKVSKNCWKNYGINVGLILGKLWGNIGVILYYWFCGNYKENRYWKCFFEILLKLARKFEEMWGILCTNFLIIWWKFCHIFLWIFGKTYEKLLEKYEKYFMVSVSFKNTVITLCIMTFDHIVSGLLKLIRSWM